MSLVISLAFPIPPSAGESFPFHSTRTADSASTPTTVARRSSSLSLSSSRSRQSWEASSVAPSMGYGVQMRAASRDAVARRMRGKRKLARSSSPSGMPSRFPPFARVKWTGGRD